MFLFLVFSSIVVLLYLSSRHEHNILLNCLEKKSLEGQGNGSAHICSVEHVYIYTVITASLGLNVSVITITDTKNNLDC